MLTAGQEIELLVERPAAGGRMVARPSAAGGQVILVSGAVPGERVIGRIDRAERDVAFASTVDVKEPSADRRSGFADPLCGGCVYSHIDYPRQLDIKAEVIADAFRRIGRLSLGRPVAVSGSPETGYRMRARLHVDNGRIGFYREGTHTLCDAAATRQLSAHAVRAASTAVEGLTRAGADVTAVELSENVAGDERALAAELAESGRLAASQLEAVVAECGLRGLVTHDRQGARFSAGDPSVSDAMGVLTRGRVSRGALQRGPLSFFQANRFLIADLVTAVLDSVTEERAVLDLYAGVGLFSLALASSGRRVTAVEGDRFSGVDLQRNAAGLALDVPLTVVLNSVEGYLDRHRCVTDTIIVDPPRAGISRAAIARVTRQRATRVIYVSCDPATLARDARRFIDAGYAIRSMRAFDFFPNTPHVETVAVFDRKRGEEINRGREK